MPESRYNQNNNSCGGCQSTGAVCIDCSHILDSCKDKDCFEDTKVFLTGIGQELIEKSTSVRAKSAKVVHVSLGVEPVQFNRGFYRIFIRYFTKLCFEACICPGKSQDFEGIAVCDKQVILYGSEGSVKIFKSDPHSSCGFCSDMTCENASTNLPTAVVEVTDPICLNTKVVSYDSCCSCCHADDIPDNVCECIDGCLGGTYDERRQLTVSLGFFSVVRMERPGQYLVNAAEYCVPDKECVAGGDNDPCSLFKQMDFPTAEFCPPSYRCIASDGFSGGEKQCGCDKKH